MNPAKRLALSRNPAEAPALAEVARTISPA
jgi:hypothetical protein